MADQNNKRDRTIGEGMNSPDSTQMPLKASTGEPDWETQTNAQGNRKSGGSDASSASDASKASDSSATPRGARQNTGGGGDDA